MNHSLEQCIFLLRFSTSTWMRLRHSSHRCLLLSNHVLLKKVHLNRIFPFFLTPLISNRGGWVLDLLHHSTTLLQPDDKPLFSALAGRLYLHISAVWELDFPPRSALLSLFVIPSFPGLPTNLPFLPVLPMSFFTTHLEFSPGSHMGKGR